MTGWILFLCILALILFLLFLPAVVDFCYEQEKATVRISYCGIRLFDSTRQKKASDKKSKRKKSTAKKKKKKKKRKQDGSGTFTTEDTGASLSQRLEQIRSLLTPVSKGLRRLFRGIRISRWDLDIQVGNLDACACALAYGKIYAAVANGLAFFQSFFSIKLRRVSVTPCFGTEKTVCTLRFRAKLSPAAVLAAGLSLAISYLRQSLAKDA
jgi:hypothetical protein